jgi:hypothetical protein
MKVLVFTLLAAGAMTVPALLTVSASPAPQTFVGIITDSMCAKGDHAGMRMGPTDADCTTACVSIHGASYVLYDGRNSYTLSDQQTPEKFAGQKVKVVGTLDAKSQTIKVASISAAK